MIKFPLTVLSRPSHMQPKKLHQCHGHIGTRCVTPTVEILLQPEQNRNVIARAFMSKEHKLQRQQHLRAQSSGRDNGIVTDGATDSHREDAPIIQYEEHHVDPILADRGLASHLTAEQKKICSQLTEGATPTS